jgi:hypothetical protein
MPTPPTHPATIRFCSNCGAAIRAEEPCLPCALARTLLDVPESDAKPTPEPVRTVFDPTALPCDFGRYEVRREIAIGGMGAVYEAYDTRLGRTVALKLIAGESLATRLKGGPLALREAAALMATVAKAVSHAHGRGVLHRDLKPANILLDEKGQPWLTDFGLAKLTAGDSDLTRTGASLGTPEYMSPEPAGGRVREISAVSDVWALGAILFQMVTGRVPFGGDSPAEVFKRIADDEPGSWCKEPDQLASVPADLSTVINRCLQKEAARRPPSALYVAEELERWLSGQAILSRPVSRVERGGRWLRQHPWPVTAIVAAAVALLIIAFAVSRPDSNPPGPGNVRRISPNDTFFRVSVQVAGNDGWL